MLLDPRLEDAIARGATIVTPNKRLAREIVARHDAARRDEGLLSWEPARALPWNAFVVDLWQRAGDAGAPLPARRLDAGQAALLWQAIVAADLGDRAPLVDPIAAASEAGEAWQIVQAYGAGGESWRGFADAGADPAAFARWAGSFVRETAARDALDVARIPDALARLGDGLRELGLAEVVLAGFLERTPQQQRLADALSAAGVTLSDIAPSAEGRMPKSARLAAVATPRDELAVAIAWARDRARFDPGARVGVVVADLQQDLDLVRALADDLLCPSLQWPGREDAARPYDVSAARPLAATPPVATALDLIALLHGPVDVATAAALVRSPFLPDAAAQWVRRAALERGWSERGTASLALPAFRAALAKADPSLAARFESAEASVRAPSRAAPRTWGEVWRRWLLATGWCEGRALSSAEFQAKGAWGALLTAFAALSGVSGDFSRSDALAHLRRLALDTPFQPESNAPSIRILGLLEAAGIAFDALWVTGMTAEAWPPAPAPNPLLPVAWQRERGVPRSHPARELDYARRLTAWLARAAPEVVFSYASTRDDHGVAPSPLVATLERVEVSPPPVSTACAQRAAAPAPTEVPDATAPAPPSGAHLHGGAALLDAQSTCPFRATVRHRLGAREWPEPSPLLDAAERGDLVHAALEAFWRELRTHAALVALDDDALDARVAAAAATALRTVDASRWRSLPPVVAAGEASRLARTLRDWLVSVERPRQPFQVIALEAETARRARVGPIALDVKFDRLDLHDDGTVAILDYKSGRATPPHRWFADRPQALQVALYATVHAQGEGAAPVSALAYGQLKPGEVRAVGLVDDDARFPGLADPSSVRGAGLADWADAQARLGAEVAALADAIGRGEAAIAPRDTAACTWCHLHAVCRIAGHDEPAEDEDAQRGGDA